MQKEQQDRDGDGNEKDGKLPPPERLPGESKQDYRNRCSRTWNKNTRVKRKIANELAVKNRKYSRATKFEMQDDVPGGFGCTFGKLVLGLSEKSDTSKKEVMNRSITRMQLRLRVDRHALQQHVEGKDKYDDILFDHWKISFYVNRNELRAGLRIGNNTKRSIRENDVLIPWTEVRKSKIEGAGLGLFASRSFQVGELVGIYNGSDHVSQGMEGYSLKCKWGIVHCYSFSNCMALRHHTVKTMGMQMMNDPNFGKEPGEKPSDIKPNVIVRPDLLCEAIRDINEGDEMLMSYNMSDEVTDDDEEREDDKSDPSDDANDGDYEDEGSKE